MNKEFTTLEISLKLKGLGFDEPCFGIFDTAIQNKLCYGFSSEKGYTYNQFTWKEKTQIILSPLWQQVIDWFREKYGYYINIHQLFYSKDMEIAYFYSIESNKSDTMIYDYQDKYGDILDASSQNIKGNYLNDELYIKNIFEMDFAYKTYEECREKVILKAIELCQKTN